MTYELIVIENGEELNANELEIEADLNKFDFTGEEGALYFCPECSAEERKVFHVKPDHEFMGVRG